MMDNKRLVLEYNAMRERWGDSPVLCKSSNGKLLWWEYELQQEKNIFPVMIAYPNNFPAEPPQIITKALLPKDTPHILPDKEELFGKQLLPGKRLCWIYPGDKRNINKWCPSRDTAAMCITVAMRWFLAFQVWYSTPNRTFDDWPVPDAVN